ncbi:MAG: hypothetical protein Q8M05_12905 [Rhodoferax sp.]|nr:hypothetical protein [Rhodoferax sp.]MDP1530273.1 hypothetical protein [Rhodoferax sp.]MDP1943380.1 hypothetical protein [Rhodoferax sp.]
MFGVRACPDHPLYRRRRHLWVNVHLTVVRGFFFLQIIQRLGHVVHHQAVFVKPLQQALHVGGVFAEGFNGLEYFFALAFGLAHLFHQCLAPHFALFSPLAGVRVDRVDHLLCNLHGQHLVQQLVNHPAVELFSRKVAQTTPHLAFFVRQTTVIVVQAAIAPGAVGDLQRLAANAACQQAGKDKAALGRAADFMGGAFFHHGLHLFKIFLADNRRMAGHLHHFFRWLVFAGLELDLVEQPHTHVRRVFQNQHHRVLAPRFAIAQQPGRIHAQRHRLGAQALIQSQLVHLAHDGGMVLMQPQF